jgi:protein-disulfide isomerase-like protein with CxxC motif
MNAIQVRELLLQSLEHERGGVKIYKAAIAAAQRDDLKAEWTGYLAQTEQHVETLTGICGTFGIDPFTTTPGTQIVRANGAALLQAIEQARAAGDPAAAQIVAAECVVLAETKDHMNWELLGDVAEELDGEQREALMPAVERIEDEEDEHLYHTQGWARELWLEALGLPAQLPPPEEVEDVSTAVEAQQARESRQPHH